MYEARRFLTQVIRVVVGVFFGYHGLILSTRQREKGGNSRRAWLLECILGCTLRSSRRGCGSFH